MSKYESMSEDELGIALIELFERGVVALEKLAEGVAVADIQQPAIESLTLAMRDTR